ncbi:MAG TPA: serine acetyltransferase [Anaeromyxobacteraceae bacterium]|nr:serine acetyltransferase [Anaeromyxobacteraceae bacterium]
MRLSHDVQQSASRLGSQPDEDKHLAIQAGEAPPALQTANSVSPHALARLLNVFEALKRDAGRYVNLGGWYRSLGFWVGATHRIDAWSASLPSNAVRVPIRAACRAVQLSWRLLLNVQISPRARIGPGLCLIHPSDIMIPATEIGDDCLIFHDVTIGTNPVPAGCPKIGNHVDIYVGARVLGGIVVGHGAKIGANCVVNRNVPPGCVVVLAPNRVVPATIAAAFGSRSNGTDSREDT